MTDDQRRAALREDVLSLLSMIHGEPSWREFERLKRIWRARHPDASPAEYGGCMRLLAIRMGL